MEMRVVAINFLKTLSKEDKEKLKIMISHNIQCELKKRFSGITRKY